LISETKKKENRLSERIFELSIFSTSFLFPLLPKFLPWIIAINILFFLINENFKLIFKKVILNKYTFLFIAVYLIYLLGMIYSENKIFGWNDMGMKLSLMIFPLILAGNKIDWKKNLNRILQAFVAGCFLSAAILILRASYLYLFRNQNAFFYESLSFYFHPSYLALYFDFAIAIILFNGEGFNQFGRILKIAIVSLLSISVILLSSKAGLLGLVLVYLVAFIILAVSRKSAKFIFLLLIILSAIYFVLNYFIDRKQNRFIMAENVIIEKELDKKSAESSTVRIFVWKSCIDLIKLHPVFGVGTGDVKDALVKSYEVNGISGALAKKLNAHNQFLQTAVALGILGLIILLTSLLFPLIRFIRYKEWLAVCFLLLIIFNFLFESMLERQDGIVFYAFFNAVLFYSSENNAKG